jgi:hypothetical protein
MCFSVIRCEDLIKSYPILWLLFLFGKKSLNRYHQILLAYSLCIFVYLIYSFLFVNFHNTGTHACAVYNQISMKHRSRSRENNDVYDEQKRNVNTTNTMATRNNSSFVLRVTIGISVCLVTLFAVLVKYLPNDTCGSFVFCLFVENNSLFIVNLPTLNQTYPIHPPLITGSTRRYRIAVITDRDTDSKSTKDKDTWIAHMHYGYFTFDYVSVLLFV